MLCVRFRHAIMSRHVGVPSHVMLRHVMLCYVTCFVTPRNVSWYAMLFHDMRHGVRVCHVMSCYVSCYVYVMLCYFMLCHVMSYCHALLCHVMSWYLMSWCAMLCHGMSCFMSCYVMSVTLLSCCSHFAIGGMSPELHRIEAEWFAMSLPSFLAAATTNSPASVSRRLHSPHASA